MSRWRGRARALFLNPAAAASALLVGNLLLYTPALVYEGNPVEFVYGFPQVALPLALLFILLLPAFSAVHAFLPLRAARNYTVVLTGLAVSAWINSAFFIGSRGMLDGKTFSLITDRTQIYVNAFAFLAIGIAAGWAALRATRAVTIFLIVLNAGLLANTAMVAVGGDKPWRGKAEPEKLLQFSGESNVLLILLDSFQSDMFTEILKDQPQVRAGLRGFTFFPNAVGAAPTTYLALPAIHAAYEYRAGASLKDIYVENIERGSFVTRLVEHGYQGFVVNAIKYCPQGATCDDEIALLDGRNQHVLTNSAKLLDVAIFRMVPHALKKRTFRGGLWLLSSYVGSYTDRMHALSNMTLESIAKRMTVAAGAAPTVKFIHGFSSHAPAGPYLSDRECRQVRRPWRRPNALENNICVVKHVLALLDALKDKGIYDQTAILVLGDHGSGMALDGTHYPLAYASPLLMVKPMHATRSFAVSQRLVGLTDIPATVCAMTGNCRYDKGSDVLESKHVSSSYNYVSYTWRGGYWMLGWVPIEGRYEIKGPPLDAANWWRRFDDPLAPQERIRFDGRDESRNLGVGWLPVESSRKKETTRRWAAGPAADLYLTLPPGRDAYVTLQVSTHAANRGQRMTISANEVTLKSVDVPVNVFEKIEFVVPARMLATAPTRLIFRFSHHNPEVKGDTRARAVQFDELQVR